MIFNVLFLFCFFNKVMSDFDSYNLMSFIQKCKSCARFLILYTIAFILNNNYFMALR